ncbi:MAG: tetratricopeptide repeat protein [Deltaproteobacteria bacterium]|nr:tetratricopeptide repeat protein [Deltaproteobacteria bacterium]
MKIINSIILVLLVISSLGLGAEAPSKLNPKLTEVYTLYNKGVYPQAILLLDKILIEAPNLNDKGLLDYWLGICNSKQQNYIKAISHFEKAILKGMQATDIYYELGQAQYTVNQLKTAKNSFKKSMQNKYKTGAALYYIGSISQILEEFAEAENSYQEILKLDQDNDKVKQAALLQLAEIGLIPLEKLKDKKIKNEKILNTVIPAYKKAKNYDLETAVAKQAQTKIDELEQLLGQEVAHFKNGMPMPQKLFTFKCSEELKYDTNVVTQADQAITLVSNKASALLKSEIFTKFEKIIEDSWSISPEIYINHTIHAQRTTPSVYQNDQVSLSATLKNRYEHTWLKQPAGFSFDMDYNLLLRDYQQNHSYLFYSRYYNFTLSERTKIFSAGNTTLSGNLKLYANESEGLNATNPAGTLSQLFDLTPEWNLLILFNIDYNRARDQTNDKLTYKLSTSLNKLNLFWDINTTFGFDFSYINTKQQLSSRGYEKTLSPSLTFRKNWTNMLSTALSYNFTRNISLDTQNYAYSKHIIGLGVFCQI